MLPNTITAAADPAMEQVIGPVSARVRRVWLLVSAILIMNAFDLALTLMAQAEGLLVESNPIAHSLLPHGPVGLLLFKVFLVGFGSWVLIWQGRQFFAESMAWIMTGIYVAVSVRWLMCYRFYEIIVGLDPGDYTSIPIFGLLL